LTAVDASGKTVKQSQVINDGAALRAWLRQVPSPRQVVVEASGFWPAFARAVQPEAQRLVMVHPQRMKAIASARLKNDKVDSETLAQLSRADLLPEAWMANERTQQARLLTRLRITLGQQRAKAKNQLQAVLHQEGFLKPVADVFGKTGRVWLAGLALSPAGRMVVEVWLKIVDQMTEAIATQEKGPEGDDQAGPAGQVAGDGAGDRVVLGDGDPGRGGRDRTLRQQAGAGQLRRTDAHGARVGRQEEAGLDRPSWFRNPALDPAAGGAGRGSTLARRTGLVSAAEEEETRTGSPASSLILCPKKTIGRTSSDGAAGNRTPLVCPEHE